MASGLPPRPRSPGPAPRPGAAGPGPFSAPGASPASGLPAQPSLSLPQLLGAWGVAADPAGPVSVASRSVAEDLAQWLGWTDALALAAVLQAGPAAEAAGAAPADPAPLPPLPAAGRQALAADLAALRWQLGARLVVPASGSPDAPDAPDDASPDFAPWRRHCSARQRAMGQHIAPMRTRLRDALARQSPQGARLAALDAVLEQGLAAQERQRLAALPGWLEQRFRQARAQPSGAASPDDGLAERLTGFRQDVFRLLTAELALRLQPLDGLLAALDEQAGKACTTNKAGGGPRPTAVPLHSAP